MTQGREIRDALVEMMMNVLDNDDEVIPNPLDLFANNTRLRRTRFSV